VAQVNNNTSRRVSFSLSVQLEPGTTLLKEVTVKADRIREQGDTITYNVGSFAQQQDRSISDVLKRMPGINVEQSGKIQYQGGVINKFYIEGSDLLGGKYGIATNGISHEDVGAAEVMENHQPMQVFQFGRHFVVSRSENQRRAPLLAQFRLSFRVDFESYVHERHKRLVSR